MRNLFEKDINRWRMVDQAVIDIYGSVGNEIEGRFRIPSPLTEEPMIVIACSGNGWDHISVSLQRRTPVWHEMESIKRLFFHPEETAFQLHVPVAQHINNHPHVLHIWRPHHWSIPLPPREMV